IGEGDYALRFACMLRKAGFAVTRLLREVDLDRSVDLSRFGALVTLNGTDWGGDRVSEDAQRQIGEYVSARGGFVAVEWAVWQNYTELGPLLPVGYNGWTNGTRQHTVQMPGHPIVQGLPASYAVPYHGYTWGPPRADSSVLIRDENTNPALAVRPHGAGRVAWFAAANNWVCFDWLSSPELSRAFVRAVAWTAQEASMPDVSGDMLA